MVIISTKCIDFCNTAQMAATVIATAGTITTASITKYILFKPSYSKFSVTFLKFRCNGNRGQSWKNLTNIA